MLYLPPEHTRREMNEMEQIKQQIIKRRRKENVDMCKYNFGYRGIYPLEYAEPGIKERREG